MKLFGTFVGINKYKDSRIRPLRFATRDAQQFYKVINERIKSSERRTWLLTDEAATKTEVMKLIGTKLASQVLEDDIVLLYLSTHGSPETSGNIDDTSRYLIMHDTDYNDIFSSGIDLERELTTLVKRIRSKWVLFIVDSCFSGKAGGRTFEGPVLSSLSLRGKDGISLQSFSLGQGRIMIAACDDDEVALESERLEHGVFTFQLLRVLTDPRIPNVKSDFGHTIGVGMFYEEVAKRVAEFTGGKQRPILNGRLAGAQIPMLI